MWVALVPFAICAAVSILYLVKGGSKVRGIIALLTIPLQMIILWSLVFNKILIFYAKYEFNFLNALFSLNEILIVIELLLLYPNYEKLGHKVQLRLDIG